MIAQVNSSLIIDCAKACREIEDFINFKVKSLHRKGAVVGLSGGLDSCVVAFLAVRALGNQKVTALFLPERDSSPQSRTDALLVAEKLKINFRVRSLTQCLRDLDAYSTLVAKIIKSKTSAKLIHRVLKRLSGQNLLLENLKGSDLKLMNQLIAFYRIKHRMRMIAIYQYAESENLAVLGCANRTERMTGFFVRYGDDSGDLLPIVHLYKMEVKQLGQYLNIPERILKKAPTPDLFPQMIDEQLLGITYSELDPILWHLEKGNPTTKIAQLLSVPLDQVEYVKKMVEFSSCLREVPYKLKNCPL